ncbi:MAG TPA: patatin-like phospholipase family protein [Anaerolineales bacterium]
MREITLALGGGGIKGFAHVGVLRVLEREGFRIRAIAGTSAGGMVGACYAAGSSPDELERCLLEMDQDRLYARQPGDGPAMMGLGGVLNMLNQLLGEKTFQDVRLPLAVTAVNLETAQLLALRRGRLLDAVLATIAVPGVFPPRRWEGQTLVDGGILDPVPVALARYLAPSNPVVAVVLSPPASEWVRPTPPRLFASLPFVSSYLGRMRLAQALNIFLRSIDIAGLELTELRLQVDQPEVIIRPAVPHIGFMDSVNVSEVVGLGEQAAIEALPDLRRAVGLRGWFSQRASRRHLPKTVLDWEKDCE